MFAVACWQVSQSHVVYPGLSRFQEGKRLESPIDIPGMREAGWTLGQLAPLSQVRRRLSRPPTLAWVVLLTLF
jgi:hypothetical protein